MSLPIDEEWTKPAEVVGGLEGLEAAFAGSLPPDPRGVFASAYLAITRRLAARVASGADFADAAWVERYLVAFAERYRRALDDYEHGRRAQVPAAWLRAFDAGLGGNVTELHALALGINAHIRHDLPLALRDVGIGDPGPEQQRRHQDHTRVNLVLAEAVEEVQERLARLYNPVLRWLDWAAGRFDEMFTVLHFEEAREAAWRDAVALGDETTTTEEIDREAEMLARQILDTSLVELALLFARLSRPAALSGELLPDVPLPAALGDAIEALENAVEDLDRERSRLALLPALHAEILQAVAHRLGRGRFADGAWATEVASGTAVELLRALQAFRSGEAGRVPASWAVPMQMAQREDVTGLQLVALAANAIARHDLAFSLFRQDVRPETLESHRQDYARLVAAMDAAVGHALLAATVRYPGYAVAVDEFGEALGYLVDDFSFARAAQAGFAHALAIAAARHDAAARRQEFVSLDFDTARAAQRIALAPRVQRPWLVGALRQRERRWPHPWSEWLRGNEQATAWRDVLGKRFALLPLPLRVLLGERAERRVRGAARGTAKAPWPLESLLERLGLPMSRTASNIRIEGRVDGPREHWLQVVGGSVLPTRQWNDGGLLAVAFEPWRFRFHLEGDAERLRLEQRDARFALLPVPAPFAPQVAVEVTASREGLEVRVSIDAPLLGRLVDYRARLRPE